MIDVNVVEITGALEASNSDTADIYKCLKTLYMTPVGTVPFDREFGIDFSIVDGPVNMAQARLTVEYIEKTRKYETRASVKEVSFEADADNGKLNPKVVIEI